MPADTERQKRLKEANDCLQEVLVPILFEYKGEHWTRNIQRGDPHRLPDPMHTFNTIKAAWNHGFSKIFGSDEEELDIILNRILVSREARIKSAHRVVLLSSYHTLHYLGAIYDLVSTIKTRVTNSTALSEHLERLRVIYNEQCIEHAAELSGQILARKDERLTSKRITDPEDDDLLSVSDLQDELFSEDEISDRYSELKQWVSEIDQNKTLLPSDHLLDDILLVLKCDKLVVGYLYAQHYINRELIFISYLAVSRGDFEMHEGIKDLLVKLIKTCDRSSKPWRAILGEVEEVRGKQRHRAEAAFSRFRAHSQRLQDISGANGKLFMLDIPYTQPPVRPEDMREYNKEADCLQQRLLYFARDVGALATDGCKNYMLEPSDAINVFDTLLMCVYGDAHQNSQEYQEFLRKILNDDYYPWLKEGVRLVEK